MPMYTLELNQSSMSVLMEQKVQDARLHHLTITDYLTIHNKLSLAEYVV